MQIHQKYHVKLKITKTYFFDINKIGLKSNDFSPILFIFVNYNSPNFMTSRAIITSSLVGITSTFTGECG